jgi:hypothetical protein
METGKKEDLVEARRLLFKQLSIFPSQSAIPLYNIACVEALLGNKEFALSFLQKAVLAGYSNYKHMEQDQDLVSLTQTQEFKDIVAQLKLQESQKETVQFSIHQHPLTRVHNLCRHYCDKCAAGNITDAFRCSQCDFDLCLSCAKNEDKKQEVPKPEIPKVEDPKPEVPKQDPKPASEPQIPAFTLPANPDPSLLFHFVQPLVEKFYPIVADILQNTSQSDNPVHAGLENLQILQEMGWTDVNQNIQALIRAKGDLVAAVEILLDQ